MNVVAKRCLLAMATMLATMIGNSAMAAEDIDAARAYAGRFMPGLDPRIIEGAKKEGEVVIYNLQYPQGLNSVFGEFRKAFPFVRVTSSSITGGAIYEKFRTEELAGRHTADLWQHSAPPAAEALVKQKLLLNWTPPNDKRVPDEWKNSGWWYPVGLYRIAMVWNSDAIAPAEEKALLGPVRWDEMIQPRWKGRLGIAHVRTGGSAYIPYYFLYKTYGADFYGKIAANNPLVLNSNIPLSERLAAGEVVMVPTMPDTVTGFQYSKGVKVKWVYPEPALASVYVMGISAGAPHMNAAKLFLAWSISAPGQAAWSQAGDLTPVSADVEDRRPVTREPWYRKTSAQYFKYTWDEVNAALPEMFAVHGKYFK